MSVVRTAGLRVWRLRSPPIDDKITIIDDDKNTFLIDLSFDPPSLDRDAGKTPVVVTATINGETIKDGLSFTLVMDGTTTPEALSRELGIDPVLLRSQLRSQVKMCGRDAIRITP